MYTPYCIYVCTFAGVKGLVSCGTGATTASAADSVAAAGGMGQGAGTSGAA